MFTYHNAGNAGKKWSSLHANDLAPVRQILFQIRGGGKDSRTVFLNRAQVEHLSAELEVWLAETQEDTAKTLIDGTSL